MAETEAPEPKKQKASMSEAPDNEWPDCWLMADECENQKAENRRGKIYLIF